VIGIGVAGYALFAAQYQFTPLGHFGLVAAVLGIALVGSIIQKRRRKTVPEEREEVPEDKITSRPCRGARSARPIQRRKRLAAHTVITTWCLSPRRTARHPMDAAAARWCRSRS
jgi:hypothetical protein